jgi:hypothetical protein
MVVCSSDALIHVLTCSYSLNQIEEEHQEKGALDYHNYHENSDDHYDDRHEVLDICRTEDIVPNTKLIIHNTRDCTATIWNDHHDHNVPPVVLTEEQHQQQQRSYSCRSSSLTNPCSSLKIYRKRRHKTTASSNISNSNSGHYHHAPIMTKTKKYHFKKLIPPTIQEDVSLEDLLVLESRGWFLKSLLDLDDSKSGD